MSEQSNPNRDDDTRQAAILHGLAADAAAPDAAVLASLRERSLAAFMEAATADPPSSGQNHTLPVPGRNQRMSTLMVRSWALMIAAAAAVIVWFQAETPPAAGGAPFSAVLAELKNARSLEFRVTRNGQTSEVWIRSPGLVRWDEAPGRYRIAAGSRLWKIDETARTTIPGDAPWFRSSEEPVDLVKLLTDDVADTSPLSQAAPAGRANYGGRQCVVYRATVLSSSSDRRSQRLALQAFVDADDHRTLRGITARPEGTPANGPPLAELQLVAMNPPVDEGMFALATSLIDGDRLGKISDVQGIVGLRPVMARRWTPVYREIALRPGDWVRTEIRGANAARVRLASEVELTLGPGSLLECLSPTQARLHSGEVQINVARRHEQDAGKPPAPPLLRPSVSPSGAHFELLGPQAGGEKFTTAGKRFLRLDRTGKLARLDDPKAWPKWVAGFEGTATEESLGSLIVNLPDGRNEPLTVGYHKVDVEIRDQIARTTIEESFVNHTDARLEGVFHFPLPSDASISGFGMWIGSELVEADVVEKQRAREIYETILRERRDPGLLEWTSGNLFKARVFPIEARSEKRVKIVYTQVLPLRGNEYRYTYGLRSDLLRTKPVRELSLSVTVNSELPLSNVACSTHPARTELAEHSAKVEFTAQEYAPDRDFEVVCELGGRHSDVVVIPHRRGDDGYLLVELMPPAAEGNWRRELLPESEPLSLVLLCDTSGSMDSEKRRQQTEFVAALLSALGDQDRFLLAAADTSTAWFDGEPREATDKRIDEVRKFLEKRISLGWTDLDQAVKSVLAKAPAGTQVIYVGDGLVTAGDRKPASFVNRFRKLLADRRAANPDEAVPTFHTVSVGNTHEAVVLRGMAAAGGSARAISGERSPQLVAAELLGELSSPGWRDLSVEFRGVRTAAVYPERLPNVAAGTQQLIVARYLPEGNEQTGEVVVTGKRGGETVRYAAKIRFPDSDEGNSFIPRLWARSHLDHLLAQGNSPAIQDEIIGLSEAFHIITPYTSLLVLETDADRERFGVKRRDEMRDGERFFQKGRDDATFELARQQMLRAGDWRIGLRRDVLRRLALLGRPPHVDWRTDPFWSKNAFFRQSAGQKVQGLSGYFEYSSNGVLDLSGSSLVIGGLAGTGRLGTGALVLSGVNTYAGSTAISSGTLTLGGMGGAFGGVSSTLDGAKLFDDDYEGASTQNMIIGEPTGVVVDNSTLVTEFGDRDDMLMFRTAGLGAESRRKDLDARQFGFDKEQLTNELALVPRIEVETSSSNFEIDGETGPLGLVSDVTPFRSDIRPGEFVDVRSIRESERRLLASSLFGRYGESLLESDSLVDGHEEFNGSMSSIRIANLGEPRSPWLSRLFPHLPPPPAAAAKLPEPWGWSAEAIAVARSLVRGEALRNLTGGVAIESTSESFDPVWDRQTGRSGELTLYSPAAWLTRPRIGQGDRVVNYCDDQERGVFSLAFGLGQTRAAVERDRTTYAPTAESWLYAPLFESYPAYTAQVEPAGNDRVRLVVSYDETKYVRTFLIDTARHVVLEIRDESDGKLSNSTRYSDFVEIGGVFWTGKVETFNLRDRLVGRTTYDVKGLAPDAFAAKLREDLAPRAKVQFLRQPAPRLADARRRVADGSATFDDRIVMALAAGSRQLWDELLEHLTAAEKIAADKPPVDKPGVRWLRTVVLGTIRRNDEARARHLDEARKLVAGPGPSETDDLFLAGFLLSCDQTISSPAEQLELLEILRPIFHRGAADSYAMAQWRENLIRLYQQLSRTEESLAQMKLQAEIFPWETHRQTNYAQALAQAGRPDEATAWLEAQLARPVERADYDDDSLRASWFGIVRGEARWNELLPFTTRWIDRKPSTQSGYEYHLEALLDNNRLDDALTLAERWLKEACVERKLAPDVQARMQASLRFADGYLPGLYFQRSPIRMLPALEGFVRYFLNRDDGVQWVRQVMQAQFAKTEGADRIRGTMLRLLVSDANKLSVEQVRLFAEMALGGRLELAKPLEGVAGGGRQLAASEVPDSIWKAVAARLQTRWEAAAKEADPKQAQRQNTLAETLVQIYRTRFAETELLPFLRRRIETADDATRLAHRFALFETILAHAWTDEIEREAFALLETLSVKTEPGFRLVVEVPALHRLVDWLLTARAAAAKKELFDAGESHQLTRSELAAKFAEIRKAAEAGVAERLGATAAELARRKDPLADWCEVERARLSISLDKDLDRVAAFVKRTIGDAPPPFDGSAESETDPARIARRVFARLLYARALAIDTFLVVRNITQAKTPDAKAASTKAADELLAYIDQGIAAGDHPNDDARTVAADAWRRAKFDLLVALDRPEALERVLREWIRDEATTAPWRAALALLAAERGNLDEAITLFEANEKLKLLGPPDYRRLADWYLARNRRADHDRAVRESYRHISDQYLGQLVQAALNTRRRAPVGGAPADADERVFAMLGMLFEKAASPENYLYLVRDMYQTDRDYRGLQMLPDAVLGRTSQQIYKLLVAMKDQVLYDLRNEAASDEIIARIKALRTGERSASDLRALDLLEAIVERQAAEVLDQKGPHVDACLAALKRAFAGHAEGNTKHWAEGEPREMALYLAALGKLPTQGLVDEQLYELRTLHEDVLPGAKGPMAGRDRLVITAEWAKLLFRSYGRDEALRLFAAELASYAQANGGKLPIADDDTFDQYLQLLSEAGRHAAVETAILDHLKEPVDEAQRAWFDDRLWHYYNGALDRRGEVSLGSGEKLFSALVDLGLRRIDAAGDDNARRQAVERLTNTFQAAVRLKLKGVERPLEDFAFVRMPAILRRITNSYAEAASTPISLIASGLGPKQALRYVVEVMEHRPDATEHAWNNVWNQLGGYLAEYRANAEEKKLDLSDLEPRVLALVVAELRRDLREGESRNRQMYALHHNYYWSAKASAFAAAAEEIYRDRKGSGRGVTYVAEYVRNGLELHTRSVEMLLVAQADGLLDLSERSVLVEWLQADDRWAESIPLLEQLVESQPDEMHRRAQLMRAYFHTSRPAQLAALFKQTDEHFRAGERRTDVKLAEFAQAALDCERYREAIGLFSEAITTHRRLHGDRTVNDESLSIWYQQLAHAYSQRGQTSDAVEAASGAIVCWSARHERRRGAIDSLRDALRAAGDLDAYLKLHEDEAARTGQDNPLVRKLAGEVYQERGEQGEAIAQFKIARELQPTDREVSQALIRCYDELGRPADATRQLLAQIDYDRHDLKLYEQLADRLKNDEGEAERAATSIVEAGAEEAENHKAAAELRQKQGRWNEAIDQWRDVAELRRLEPTGLLGLAAAQVHQRQWNDARETIKKLEKTEWPIRFQNELQKVRDLRRALPKE